MRIEFLTEDEKVKKDKIFKELDTEYADDL